MKRGLMLGGLAACVFVVVAALMLKFMPAPLKESDYMVIGSVATLLALGAVFLVLVSTTMKSTDVFFKKRRK
jgi:predicted outer membrane lipoprotein